MWKIKKWLEQKTASGKEYEEEKREFENAIGKPFITLRIELPNGFESQRVIFMSLENNTAFKDDVEDLVKKTLISNRGTDETPSEHN